MKMTNPIDGICIGCGIKIAAEDCNPDHPNHCSRECESSLGVRYALDQRNALLAERDALRVERDDYFNRLLERTEMLDRSDQRGENLCDENIALKADNDRLRSALARMVAKVEAWTVRQPVFPASLGSAIAELGHDARAALDGGK